MIMRFRRKQDSIGDDEGHSIYLEVFALFPRFALDSGIE